MLDVGCAQTFDICRTFWPVRASLFLVLAKSIPILAVSASKIALRRGSRRDPHALPAARSLLHFRPSTVEVASSTLVCIGYLLASRIWMPNFSVCVLLPVLRVRLPAPGIQSVGSSMMMVTYSRPPRRPLSRCRAGQHLYGDASFFFLVDAGSYSCQSVRFGVLLAWDLYDFEPRDGLEVLASLC